MSEAAALERGNSRLMYLFFAAGAVILIGTIRALMNEDGSALNSGSTATSTEASDTGDSNNSDEGNCPGGGDHDMVDAGLVDSNGHSRTRRACTKCPYSYLM